MNPSTFQVSHAMRQVLRDQQSSFPEMRLGQAARKVCSLWCRAIHSVVVWRQPYGNSNNDRAEIFHSSCFLGIQERRSSLFGAYHTIKGVFHEYLINYTAHAVQYKRRSSLGGKAASPASTILRPVRLLPPRHVNKWAHVCQVVG